jgi:hypothetical protein
VNCVIPAFCKNRPGESGCFPGEESVCEVSTVPSGPAYSYIGYSRSPDRFCLSYKNQCLPIIICSAGRTRALCSTEGSAVCTGRRFPVPPPHGAYMSKSEQTRV